MPRAVWVTDIHLNFLQPVGLAAFAAAILRDRPDQVWIGGDIAEGDSVVESLRRFAGLLGCPVYFVLGNHDLYRSSFAKVHAEAAALSTAAPKITWLNRAGVVALSERAALIGHDGWADAGFGDLDNSTVRMNDYVLIEEFKGLDKASRRTEMQARGAVSAAHFREHLAAALKVYEQVYVLTHNPPFREACRFHGHITSDNWLPHLANRQAGEAIREELAAFSHRRVTVLCGHTHHASQVQIAANLEVITGAAEYRQPVVQRVFEIG
ncbi:MAG TPA: metallophosphoesterase [Planctomycetota bacterium]|nr:metallophosphoesterase [Planctomycetota bacterium]